MEITLSEEWIPNDVGGNERRVGKWDLYIK